jgi:hypothetical protein
MMSVWWTLTACVGLGLTTFGCANLPVTPAPDIVRTSPDGVQSGGTQFDGVYRGAVQITSTAPEIPRNWCQVAGDHMILRVTNDAINYTLPYANIPGSQTFSVSIAPNGSFSGVGSRNATMSGQVTGDQISGTMAGEGCEWTFSARRS